MSRVTEFAAKVAVVTGGGSGIGLATARRLAAGGADVVVASRSAGHHTDVSDEDSVRALFESVGPEIHILVNCAGVLATTALTPDIALEEWERAFAVNARGTFLCCKHALPRMRRGSAIVNVASVTGVVGVPGRAAYGASKGAVIAFTRALAVDHAKDGIRVNCVCPGTIDTPWIDRLVDELGESRDALVARQPVGRLGGADEIAEAIAYLASDRSRFVTGSELVVDGGMTAA
jgi:NAD(P)-dependent dehydrogenase (short-subunit alcohol dehydrogenase family)